MKYFSILFFSLFGQVLFGQNKLPVLKTTSSVLSIKDGEIIRKKYWSIDPKTKLDVYTADMTNKVKIVTFYSDIDSISFTIKPRKKYDFIVLLNGKDTCFTRIESGLPVLIKSAKISHDTIPFILTSFNNLSVQTIVNQVDTLNLMFHTASNSVFLTKKAIKEKTKLYLDKSSDVGSWGGTTSAKYLNNNSLRIGNLKWDNITITEDENSGQFTDGKFGYNLFQNKIIEIDYEKSLLIIHSGLPKIDKSFTKFNLEFRRSDMFIEGELEIESMKYSNKFLIHSGFGGTALLDDKFVSTNAMNDKLKLISESQLKDSFGNILKTKKVMLPRFTIGGATFSNIPIALFEGAISNQKMSVLGGDVLKRFNIFIDLQNAYVYLKPNSLFSRAF
jgi:hypothetical protein